MVRTYAERIGWALLFVALGWVVVLIAVLGTAARIIRRLGEFEPDAESDYSYSGSASASWKERAA
jgi:hypothetical protein